MIFKSSLAVSALFAATIGLCVGSPVALDAKQVRVVAGVHIDNFARVNASYFRGAQPVGRDYADLAALGVKLVINLTGSDAAVDEKAMVEQNKMRSVQIPMTTNDPPTTAQLETFLSLVADPANQPVYVHCVGGRHRTGVMTAVYRMITNGISGKDAFKEMKQFKYGPDFLHPEFKAFVQDFDAKAVATTLAKSQRQGE